MSTTDNPAPAGRGVLVPRGPFVTHDLCAAIHRDQREANERTWEEIRGLRRLVIGLVIGGQLFSGGVNFAGLAYWLQQHSAQPHPATVQLVAQARAEAREDVRDLRREVHELLASPVRRGESDHAPAPGKEGAPE